MATFTRSDDLRAAQFVDAALRGARFVRANLSGVFDQRVENTRLSIEAQRAAVDSFADNFTTILQ